MTKPLDRIKRRHAAHTATNGKPKPRPTPRADPDPGTGDPLHDSPEVRAAAAAQERKRQAAVAAARDEGSAIEPADGPPPKPSRFRFIDSTEFLGGDYRQEFLVKQAFVRGQPMVLGGAQKTLKTSVAIDLAVSIATATPFLGKFDVPRRARVAIASGESGQFTLKETTLRILKAKGLDPSALSDWLRWEFTVPTFSDRQMMDDFARRLADLGAEVVLIDPLYLALGDVDAKSVFDMGQALRPVAEHLLSRGITPGILHHSNRTLQAGEVMGLEHLSHAGMAEYARQWLLLSRREKYQGDGTHNLFLSVGGSAGHGGLWSVNVDEGVLNDDFTGRRWGVTVMTAGEAQAETIDRKEQAKEEKARQAQARDEAAVLLAIDAEVSKHGAATKSSIKNRTALSFDKVGVALNRLADALRVEEVEFTKTVGSGVKRTETGFRRLVR